jgi:protein-export membrane protein SecD
MQKYTRWLLALIAVATVAGGFFVFPDGFGAAWRPWRLGLDLVGGSRLVYEIDLSDVSESDRESVVEGIRDVIERRVNFFGVREPRVFLARSAGTPRLVVELAGKDIREAIREIGATPLLDFREVEIQEPPALAATSTAGEATSTVVFTPTELTGRFVTGAQLSFNQTTGEPEVLIAFTAEGAELFEAITSRNVGEAVAIFLDNNLISAPVVQEKISGGQAVITGDFTVPEARELVSRFNAGALPAPITLVDQRSVSATLGLDSLKKGIFAGTLGTLLVAVFMLFFYGTLGFFAALALGVYLVFTLALFKLIPITLTLAGLAGFVLTIGMAVDANILIFERTKEEIARGLPKRAAIEEGFRRAWPSIRDSNASTIITAIILYYFTSSFIRGFALTLLLGTLMSMLSAISVTRTFLRVFVSNRQ